MWTKEKRGDGRKGEESSQKGNFRQKMEEGDSWATNNFVCTFQLSIMEKNLRKFNSFLDFAVEPLRYSALLKFITRGNFGETGIKGVDLEKWRKQAKVFTEQNANILLWQGTTGPTVATREKLVSPVHCLNQKKQCKDIRILRKVLLREGCASPLFMGGLERARALSVKNT